MTISLKINGMITNNDDAPIYQDYFGMDVTTPADVDKALTGTNDDVVVEINSYGGEVDAAAQMFTTLKDYHGKVTTKIESSAYSAASVVAMAGDVVQISPVAQIMIHNSANGAQGNHHDMQRAADMLTATDKSIANAYSVKTGRPIDEFLALMDKETWIPAQEALNLGLVDEIMDFEPAAPITDAVGTLIPHSTIQKIKNLVAEKNISNSQPPKNELVQRKLAIFYGKNKEDE